ncbi:MAG TPA: HEAT repeat domain-containing protein, partial [Rhodothermales bacterium]|nr:HEAT repeat domain-containing protein [Rhodothermales bacterium]
VHASLRKILSENPDDTRKLRALWALHVTGGLSDADLIALLKHESEHIRSWSIQLLAEDRQVTDAALAEFARMSREDNSALVRLYLASAMQRVEPQRRWAVVEGLTSRAEDAEDQNLPMMVWYAMEPAVPLDMSRSIEIALASPLPKVLPFTVRRIASDASSQALEILTEQLGVVEDAEKQAVILEGINQLMGKDEEEEK